MRRRPGARRGAELRFFWGERLIAEHFLPPGAPCAFAVGSAPGVQLAMGDRALPSARFEVVRGDGRRFELRFGERMGGALLRRGERLSLAEASKRGLATCEDEAFTLPLVRGDEARVGLGDLTLEVFLSKAPSPVLRELFGRLDYTALNAFVVTFFLAALFVIAALNRTEDGAGWTDELSGARAEARSIQVRLARAAPNALRERFEAVQRPGGGGPAEAAGPEGKAGSRQAPERSRRAAARGDPRDPDPRELVAELLGRGPGGRVAVFSGQGLGGELTAMLGHLSGPALGDARGAGGLGVRGDGWGGGGLAQTIGIGSLPTRGRGDGPGSGYGTVQLKKGNGPAPTLDAGPVMVCGQGGDSPSCGLDKELIRKVIQLNRGQIRYCYERELNRFPELAGKVSVRFAIGPSGAVHSSEVLQNTAAHPELGACVASRVKAWLFPKPKTGGLVVVTYPFLFKQSGE